MGRRQDRKARPKPGQAIKTFPRGNEMPLGDPQNAEWRKERALELLREYLPDEEALDLICEATVPDDWFHRTRTVVLPRPVQINGGAVTMVHVQHHTAYTGAEP